MKKLLSIALIALSINFIPFNSFAEDQTAKESFHSYPNELEEAVSTLAKVPEIVTLINKVQEDGPVSIKFEHMSAFDFEALWNSDSRTIVVNAKNNKTKGGIITSILFELHNAKTNNQLISLFEQAQKGEINKDTYVRSVEKMEHENAVNTARLINKGIKDGIFPEDAYWPIYENFEDHYKLQQVFGHSQWLAKKYDEMHPKNKQRKYQGTIPNFRKMSQEDKDDLAKFLSLKNRLNSRDAMTRNEAQNEINEILKSFNFCKENSSHTQCSRFKKRETLFKMIFNQST